MTCMEYLLKATKEADNAIKGRSFDSGDLSLEQLNDIYNAFQLRSIAYSLAMIADKLDEAKENES